jgi:hypothetical protein
MTIPRRDFKQELSLSDRLKIFSDQLKAKASRTEGDERDALLKRAKIADAARDIDNWTRSTK